MTVKEDQESSKKSVINQDFNAQKLKLIYFIDDIALQIIIKYKIYDKFRINRI